MNIDEIPDALKELWPELRTVLQIESLKAANKSAEKSDYATIGMMVAVTEELLSQMDVIMSLPIEVSAKKATYARLGDNREIT